MANFTPSKKTAQDFNGGVKYVNYNPYTGINGDMLQAETVNNLVENALYTQTVAENAKNLVDNVVTDAYAPPLVGMHHIQYASEPTPAEIWGGTTWEIDTTMQGRTIIGSGGSYTFGETGGNAEIYIQEKNIPPHTHNVFTSGQQLRFMNELGDWENGVAGVKSNNGSYSADWWADVTARDLIGENSKPMNIMPPYMIVNYWKRTA